MKEIFRMMFVLTAICVLAGFLLAATNKITKAPIEKSRRAGNLEALKKILPDYDNDPVSCACEIKEGGQDFTFYVARKGGKLVGAAFEAASGQGYGGTIRILAGVLPDNTVQGLEILEQNETPGLGAKITEPEFKTQFAGRSMTDTKWAVTKDGGDIDAITGATISPRAVVAALKAGLDAYNKHRAEIEAAGGGSGQ